ncbi:hypothetical protein RSAG8_10712, partial [Rhizoctonia solani AG-8 WAC10335]
MNETHAGGTVLKDCMLRILFAPSPAGAPGRRLLLLPSASGIEIRTRFVIPAMSTLLSPVSPLGSSAKFQLSTRSENRDTNST